MDAVLPRVAIDSRLLALLLLLLALGLAIAALAAGHDGAATPLLAPFRWEGPGGPPVA
jgi:hypothetical protein